MKATEANLFKLLDGRKQFIIPIYQRTYSWTLKQCQQLWNDLLQLASDDKIPAHFIGSIVYIERGIYQSVSVPQLLVIDGQQRLATISILLSALGEIIEEQNIKSNISREKIKTFYLLNSLDDGELRYKLILTQSDKETYICLIEDKELPNPVSKRITENYQFFKDSIVKCGVNPVRLFEAVNKLVIVDVSLDRNYDNPQLIFESLNSTGLDLSQADLIRNYILMGLEPKKQEELYKDYWFPMEQSFGHSERSPQFDRFIRDYLTVKNSGKIPIIGEVYADFKSYVRNLKEEDIKNIVSDIYLYSKYFVKLTLLKEDDEEIRKILSGIKDLRVDVAYPFLLEVYDDYRQQRINREEFLEVLKLVESYVFRRAICGVPPGYLNKTFANLSKSVDKNNYLESLKAAFLLMDSYRRFPTNEEFKQAFVIRDIYNLRIRNYLLNKLENYEQKELINIDKCTIEHILPQNKDLSQEWQHMLGPRWMEIQSKYLHTIGNLTLTAYNPDLGDMSFIEKREDEHGFANSPLRLSRGLRNLEKWDEEEIKRRADHLVDQAVKIWSIPEVKSLESYRILKGRKDSGNYTLDDFAESLKGDMGELFREMRMRIMNLDSSVKEEFTKLYIAYKDSTSFVDVIPQKNRLRLILNMPFDEVNDPKGLCRDITAIVHHGNGDVEASIGSLVEIDYVMFLIRQSFEWQRE
ncbi:MAG: DUF262 and DUF1524 domain-containing protein [Methanothrix sp.]|nr:DUF262 and DUF1524 domain-containing protein [Methanothrix sp.]